MTVRPFKKPDGAAARHAESDLQWPNGSLSIRLEMALYILGHRLLAQSLRFIRL